MGSCQAKKAQIAANHHRPEQVIAMKELKDQTP